MGYLYLQLASLYAEENVVEAVTNLGDHEQDAHLARGRAHVVLHAVLGGELGKGGLEVRCRGRVDTVCGRGGGKVHAHEEALRRGVTELLQVEDIVAMRGKDAGDGVDDARPVGAGEGEDVVVGRHFGRSSLCQAG